MACHAASACRQRTCIGYENDTAGRGHTELCSSMVLWKTQAVASVVWYHGRNCSPCQWTYRSGQGQSHGFCFISNHSTVTFGWFQIMTCLYRRRWARSFGFFLPRSLALAFPLLCLYCGHHADLWVSILQAASSDPQLNSVLWLCQPPTPTDSNQEYSTIHSRPLPRLCNFLHAPGHQLDPQSETTHNRYHRLQKPSPPPPAADPPAWNMRYSWMLVNQSASWRYWVWYCSNCFATSNPALAFQTSRILLSSLPSWSFWLVSLWVSLVQMFHY